MQGKGWSWSGCQVGCGLGLEELVGRVRIGLRGVAGRL